MMNLDSMKSCKYYKYHSSSSSQTHILQQKEMLHSVLLHSKCYVARQLSDCRYSLDKEFVVLTCPNVIQ